MTRLSLNHHPHHCCPGPSHRHPAPGLLQSPLTCFRPLPHSPTQITLLPAQSPPVAPHTLRIKPGILTMSVHAGLCLLQPPSKLSPPSLHPGHNGHSCHVLNMTSLLRVPLSVYSSRTYMVHPLTSLRLLLRCHLFRKALPGALCKQLYLFQRRELKIKNQGTGCQTTVKCVSVQCRDGHRFE